MIASKGEMAVADCRPRKQRRRANFMLVLV